MILICEHAVFCKNTNCHHYSPHNYLSYCDMAECDYFSKGDDPIIAKCEQLDYEQMIQSKYEFGLWDTVRERAEKAVAAWMARKMDESIVEAFNGAHLNGSYLSTQLLLQT